MKNLEKLSKNNLTVLTDKQMYAALGGTVGGTDNTSNFSSLRDGDGGICYYDVVDTYDECGELISRCVNVCCE